jgi:hypothetical protein
VRQLTIVIAASVLLNGCIVLPQYGHLRPVSTPQANPLDFVCLKTDFFKPCTPVRRDHLKMMPGFREVFGH